MISLSPQFKHLVKQAAKNAYFTQKDEDYGGTPLDVVDGLLLNVLSGKANLNIGFSSLIKELKIHGVETSESFLSSKFNESKNLSKVISELLPENIKISNYLIEEAENYLRNKESYVNQYKYKLELQLGRKIKKVIVDPDLKSARVLGNPSKAKLVSFIGKELNSDETLETEIVDGIADFTYSGQAIKIRDLIRTLKREYDSVNQNFEHIKSGISKYLETGSVSSSAPGDFLARIKEYLSRIQIYLLNEDNYGKQVKEALSLNFIPQLGKTVLKNNGFTFKKWSSSYPSVIEKFVAPLLFSYQSKKVKNKANFDQEEVWLQNILTLLIGAQEKIAPEAVELSKLTVAKISSNNSQKEYIIGYEADKRSKNYVSREEIKAKNLAYYTVSAKIGALVSKLNSQVSFLKVDPSDTKKIDDFLVLQDDENKTKFLGLFSQFTVVANEVIVGSKIEEIIGKSKSNERHYAFSVIQLHVQSFISTIISDYLIQTGYESRKIEAKSPEYRQFFKDIGELVQTFKFKLSEEIDTFLEFIRGKYIRGTETDGGVTYIESLVSSKSLGAVETYTKNKAEIAKAKYRLALNSAEFKAKYGDSTSAFKLESLLVELRQLILSEDFKFEDAKKIIDTCPSLPEKTIKEELLKSATSSEDLVVQINNLETNFLSFYNAIKDQYYNDLSFIKTKKVQRILSLDYTLRKNVAQDEKGKLELTDEKYAQKCKLIDSKYLTSEIKDGSLEEFESKYFDIIKGRANSLIQKIDIVLNPENGLVVEEDSRTIFTQIKIFYNQNEIVTKENEAGYLSVINKGENEINRIFLEKKNENKTLVLSSIKEQDEAQSNIEKTSLKETGEQIEKVVQKETNTLPEQPINLTTILTKIKEIVVKLSQEEFINSLTGPFPQDSKFSLDSFLIEKNGKRKLFNAEVNNLVNAINKQVKAITNKVLVDKINSLTKTISLVNGNNFSRNLNIESSRLNDSSKAALAKIRILFEEISRSLETIVTAASYIRNRRYANQLNKYRNELYSLNEAIYNDSTMETIANSLLELYPKVDVKDFQTIVLAALAKVSDNHSLGYNCRTLRRCFSSQNLVVDADQLEEFLQNVI